MAKRNWSEEEKAAALELLADPERTFYEVRDVSGVPVGTLHGWAAAAGLERSDDVTKRATEAHQARIALKREYLRELLIDAALEHAERAREEAKPSGVQALQTAAAIAHDKFRLEMGEATSRTESRDLDAAGKARTKVDDLAERRTKKTA